MMMSDYERNDPGCQVSLIQRVERLERENRNLKSGLLFGLVVVLGIFLIGGTGAGKKTVEAETYVVKDAQGKVQARFGVTVDGGPALTFFDRKGNPRLFMGSLGLGNHYDLGLALYDDKGKPRLTFGILEGQFSGLAVSGQDGLEQVTMRVGWKGTPSVIVSDKRGKEVWKTP